MLVPGPVFKTGGARLIALEGSTPSPLRFPCVDAESSNPVVMERAEAEAIFDAGRERVVEVLLELAGQLKRLDDRLGRVEGKSVASSRNSSTAPSAAAPVTRQQRRALAREKGKSQAARERPKEACGGWAAGSPGCRAGVFA